MHNAVLGMFVVGFGALMPARAGYAGAAQDYVTAAVSDPARPAEQVELDRWRKPVEVIAFAGLKRGDRIADFLSGNAYFARIFSRVVEPEGRVYAFLPVQEIANCAPEETAGTKALEHDHRYPNVTETLHRIDPDTIRAEVTAAGFVFESQSDALRNPEDSHVRPVFDPAIRHRTDQVVLKFRKPRRN